MTYLKCCYISSTPIDSNTSNTGAIVGSVAAVIIILVLAAAGVVIVIIIVFKCRKRDNHGSAQVSTYVVTIIFLDSITFFLIHPCACIV